MIKNVSKTIKTQNSFLYSCTTRINYTNYWTAHFHCMIHYFYYFFRTHLTESAAKHGKIISKKENLSSVYSSISCDNSITKEFFVLHLKFMIVMCRKRVNFRKTIFIKHKINSLSCCQFTFFMLRKNFVLSSTLICISSFL